MKYKTACAIIINDKGEILLMKCNRNPFRGYWALLSGIGESMKGIPPEKGVIEEVRCDIGTNSFKGNYAFSLPIKEDKMTDEVVVFVGHINEDELRPDPIYSQGIRWVPENNASDFDNLAFEHTMIVKEYLNRKSTSK